MTETPKRIFLSPPHMSGEERRFVDEVFETNFVAPAGPMLDKFEAAFCERTGIAHAAAVASGTAAMHLALRCLGVGPGDEVWTPTLTFIGGVSPIVFQGATPVFFDVSPHTWTLDTDLLGERMDAASRKGKLPKAVVPVDLYGQCCDLEAIRAICDPYDVPVVVDAAEAMGATYQGRHAGKGARAAIFSFNGNKIVTTGGGGMIASDDPALIDEARYLAQQAREPQPFYEHRQIGFNYRLSALAAAVGCGQLNVLGDRVAAKRKIFDRYQGELGDLPGVSFMPEISTGTANRWLTIMITDPRASPVTPEIIRLALEQENIEARPVWKPMHSQPVFRDSVRFGGDIAESLFARGLCLPSGTQMTETDQGRVIEVIRRVYLRG